jgi:hypothetical protein
MNELEGIERERDRSIESEVNAKDEFCNFGVEERKGKEKKIENMQCVGLNEISHTDRIGYSVGLGWVMAQAHLYKSL